MNSNRKFFSNALTLSIGTSFGHLITLIATPLITRLFSPSDVGALAAIMAIVSISGVVATGRYDQAVVLPKSETIVIALVKLGTLIAIVFGATVSLAVYVFRDAIVSVTKIAIPSTWPLVFVGPLVVLVGLDQLYNRVLVRSREFKTIAYSNIGHQASSNTAKIGLGYFSFETAGLLIATVLGFGIRVFIQGVRVYEHFKYVRRHTSHRLLRVIASRYRRFPFVSGWSALINSASTQAPVILFAALFSSSIAGHFSLSHRLLSLPMALVGQSVGSVFLERAATLRDKPEELRITSRRLFETLLFIGSAAMSVVTFYGEPLFQLVLGPDWLLAGTFARWTALWLALQIASSPLSSIYFVFERHFEALFWQLGLFTSRLVALVTIGLVFNDPTLAVIVFAAVSIIMYLVLSVRILIICGNNYVRIGRSIVTHGVAVFVVQGVVRLLLVRALS